MRALVVLLSLSLLGVTGQADSTPQAAAAKALKVEYRERFAPDVVRTNVAGKYAVVQFSGTSHWSPPPAGNPRLRILLQRFSFGWQAIDEIPRPGYPDQVNDLCGFRARAIPPAVIDQLLKGMPRGDTTTPCPKDISGDAGPPDEVDAVRKKMAGTGFIPWVIVDGNYASVEQFAANGVSMGKLDGNWAELSFATIGRNGMQRGGVPAAVACRLQPFDSETSRTCTSALPVPTVQEQEAVILVEHYYYLWSRREYPQAYQFLSAAYRRAHPYASWLADHTSTGLIYVDTAGAPGPNLVTVRVIAKPNDPQLEPSNRYDTTYAGTWHVVREGGGLKLDAANLHQTK